MQITGFQMKMDYLHLHFIIKTWSDSRANHMEDDLKAYFNILSGYMEEKVDFEEFRQELEERRVKGITIDCKLTLFNSMDML